MGTKKGQQRKTARRAYIAPKMKSPIGRFLNRMDELGIPSEKYGRIWSWVGQDYKRGKK
jgi:hypothetical protein